MKNPALDLAIIGGGPAALSAALYAARAGLAVEVFERSALGGALVEISKLSNYPGYTGPGSDLAQTISAQATSFGAKVSYGTCTNLEKSGDIFALTIDDEKILARSVLIATGSEPRTLDFTPSKPVSYCALCDGDLIKGKDVAVIGGANSAVQEGIYLAGLAKSVTIISHSPLKADQYLRSRLDTLENVKILENTEATPDLLDTFDHIFVYIGKKPATSPLKNLAKTAPLLDKIGYVLINNGKSAHETAISGLFAAGDVCANAVRQVVTAVGDGAAAAIEITNYLKSR